MALANSASKLLPSLRVPFTPLSTDVFVVESFNVVQSPNDSIPAYGTPHDTISKLKSWPNHKFCLQTQADEQGNYQRWYVADQTTQNLYNYEISDAGQWKSITQTFIIPRANYVALPLSQIASPAAWSPSKAYSIGEYIALVEGDPTKYYRCTVAHPPRSTFNPIQWVLVPSVVDVTYPAPPNPPVNPVGYAVVATQEQKIGEPKLDSLYVAVQVVREKIADTQTQYSVDLDTNSVRAAVSQKVPFGTLATVVDPSGSYKSIDPSNSLWSTSTTRKAAGLAGTAVNGVATRTLYYRDNYSWPRVLNYINIQAINTDPGNASSPISSYSWFPVWLADAYDGPCDYTLVERWTIAKPIFNGDAGWNTGTIWNATTVYALNAYVTIVGDTPKYYKCISAPASVTPPSQSARWKEVSPEIPPETPLLKTEIVFRGTNLNISIPACLHESLRIWDTQLSASYPATNPPRWPSTVLSRVTVSPDQGGYLTRMFYVNTPSPTGVVTGINLTQTAGSARGFTLKAVVSVVVPSTALRLYISTSPNFSAGNFLGNYDGSFTMQGTHMQGQQTELTTVVTGATPGVTYYAKAVTVVTVGRVESRLCVASTDPQPELAITGNSGVPISGIRLPAIATTASTAANAQVGSQSILPLVLNNSGLETLTAFSATITSVVPSHREMFTFQAFPPSIFPFNRSDWKVYFNPTSLGYKAATIAIKTNAEDIFYLHVAGTGVTVAIQVTLVQEEPPNLVLTNGEDTINFGVVTDIPVVKTFIIKNVGNDTIPLQALALSMGGANGPDFKFSDLTVDSLATGVATTFTVTFDPVVDSLTSDTRTATLSIASSDPDKNPFIVYLTGFSQNPTAPGAVDPDWQANTNGTVYGITHQSDGKAIIVGDFTEVKSLPRNRIARIDSAGVVDTTFDPNANGIVRCVLVQSDGKVIIGGDFTSVAGVTRNRIARVTSAGVLDAAFNPNANGVVRCLGLRSDGEIMVGGDFTDIGGGTKIYLAQLNTNGTLDTGFVSELATVSNPGRVNGIRMLENDGMLIVGDWYDSSNTTPPPTTPPPIPTTPPPTTPPPETTPPSTTPPPTTPPPTTPPPTTPPPTTPPPTTPPPTTPPPTTPPPTTPPPTTPPPTTPPPTTPPPTTPPPTTPPPTTPPPTTTTPP